MLNRNIKTSFRVAKYIARSGIWSRREAEQIIVEGRVSVDGEIITSPALNVSMESEILVDGKKISFQMDSEIYLYHKPKGLIVSRNDELERATVFDELPLFLKRFISVGRLDKESSGILLLTNNGEISRFLELPKNKINRKYHVVVNGRLSDKNIKNIKKGLKIGAFFYKPIKIKIIKSSNKISIYEMLLFEGKNREIRNIMNFFRLKVLDLKRIAFGPYELGKLKISNYIKGDIDLIKFD